MANGKTVKTLQSSLLNGIEFYATPWAAYKGTNISNIYTVGAIDTNSCQTNITIVKDLLSNPETSGIMRKFTELGITLNKITNLTGGSDPDAWSNLAIAAVLGNMRTESLMNPGLFEEGRFRPDGKSSTGFGLVQWTPWPSSSPNPYISWYNDYINNKSSKYESSIEGGVEKSPTDIVAQVMRLIFEVRNENEFFVNDNPSQYLSNIKDSKLKADIIEYCKTIKTFNQFKSIDQEMSERALKIYTAVFMINYLRPATSSGASTLEERMNNAIKISSQIGGKGFTPRKKFPGANAGGYSNTAPPQEGGLGEDGGKTYAYVAEAINYDSLRVLKTISEGGEEKSFPSVSQFKNFYTRRGTEILNPYTKGSGIYPCDGGTARKGHIGNCIAYAYGRALEIAAEAGVRLLNIPTSGNGGSDYYNRTPDLMKSSTGAPQPGCMACTVNMHTFIIEGVNEEDGTVSISQSMWSSKNIVAKSEGDAGGFIFQYIDKAKWDPVTRNMYVGSWLGTQKIKGFIYPYATPIFSGGIEDTAKIHSLVGKDGKWHEVTEIWVAKDGIWRLVSDPLISTQNSWFNTNY